MNQKTGKKVIINEKTIHRILSQSKQNLNEWNKLEDFISEIKPPNLSEAKTH